MDRDDNWRADLVIGRQSCDLFSDFIAAAFLFSHYVMRVGSVLRSSLHNICQGYESGREGGGDKKQGWKERGVEETERGVDETERGVDETERGVDETERGVKETERGVEETEGGNISECLVLLTVSIEKYLAICRKLLTMDPAKFPSELSHHDNFFGVVISLLIETSLMI